MKQYKKKSLLLIFLGILCLSVLLLRPTYVQAKETDNISNRSQSIKKCYAMDIIFLIDQSNSMSGTAGDPPNDKFNNRVEAYRIAVEWLAQNQYSMCQGANHRIGVISFGSDVEVDLELQSIPQEQKSWEQVRLSIENAAKERKMGNTDHAKAFAAAKEMLDRNPLQSSAVPRKTAIVMVTDGRPCVPGMACDAGPQMDIYMNLLKTQVEEDFPFAEPLLAREAAIRKQVDIYGDFNLIPEQVMSNTLSENQIDEDHDFENSTYIYILALNDAYPYLNEVGDTFNDITQSHGGDLIDLTNNTSEIPLQFNEVLSRLAMIKISKGSCGSLYVQPYLSALTINVYKSVEGVPITLYYGEPAKAVYRLEQGQGDLQFFGTEVSYGTFGPTNETYSFVSPKAGEWYIDAAICEELHVVYQTFLPQDFQLLEPSHGLPLYDGKKGDYNPDDAYHLEYLIQDSNQYPMIANLSMDKDYPISIDVEIVKPDQTTQIASLEYKAGAKPNEGTWRSIDPIPVNLIGEYKVAIVSATAPCIDPEQCTAGSPFEVFDEDLPVGESSYKVNSVDHFNFVITQPGSTKIVPVHESIREKFAESPVEVMLELVDTNGASIPFREIFGDETTANTAFQGTLTLAGKSYGPASFMLDPNHENVFRAVVPVNNVKATGDGVVEVKLSGKYNYEKYLAEEPTQVQKFTRKDPILRNPIFWLSLLVFLILISVAIIVWFVYHRSRALTGYLEFSATQEEAQAIKVLISKKWDKNKIQLPFVVGGMMATVTNHDGKSGEIEICYKNRGKDERILLKSNQTKSMPGGIAYQVRYFGLTKEDRKTSGPSRKYDPYASSRNRSYK